MPLSSSMQQMIRVISMYLSRKFALDPAYPHARNQLLKMKTWKIFQSSLCSPSYERNTDQYPAQVQS